MILGLSLPGTDGLKFCKRLKGLGNTKHMPIMVLSGQKDVATAVKSKNHGVDEFMTKPVNKEKFRARIDMLLKGDNNVGRPAGSPQSYACEANH